MKTKLSIALAILLVAAAAVASEAPLIDAHLATKTTAKQILDARGPLKMNFQLSITNRSNDPVTLTRIEVRTDENSGFALANGTAKVHTLIMPGATESTWLSAQGLAPTGTQLSESLRVTVRATFRGPGGTFVKHFTELIP